MPVAGIGEVRPGDDIAQLIVEAAARQATPVNVPLVTQAVAPTPAPSGGGGGGGGGSSAPAPGLTHGIGAEGG